MVVGEPDYDVIDIAGSLDPDFDHTFSWRHLSEVKQVSKVTSGDGVLVVNAVLRRRTAVFRHVTDTPFPFRMRALM
jgi:hypothetical protein